MLPFGIQFQEGVQHAFQAVEPKVGEGTGVSGVFFSSSHRIVVFRVGLEANRATVSSYNVRMPGMQKLARIILSDNLFRGYASSC